MLTPNKLYRLTLNDRIFVGPDYAEIRRRVSQATGWDINDMPDSNVWETKRGLWPKRFKSWLHREYGADVDPKFLGDIGGIMGKMTINRAFYVDFTTEAKWKAGSFGEKLNSCWWSDMYGCSRMGLFEHGGMAMRFFSSPRQRSINRGQKGIGRAWIFPTDQDLFLFNSYGFELGVSARVLAAILGNDWKYGKIPFDLSESYINGDTAYRFSTQSFDLGESCYLPSINSDYVGYCYHCGDKVAYRDYRRFDEASEGRARLYHETCAEHDLKRCSHCDEWTLIDTLTHLPHLDQSVCHSCLTEYYAECPDCKRHFRRATMVEVHWKPYKHFSVCPDCLDKYPSCKCRSHFKNVTTLRAHQRTCLSIHPVKPTRKVSLTSDRITLTQVWEARNDDHVGGPEYWNMVDGYVNQEGITVEEVEDRLSDFVTARNQGVEYIEFAQLYEAAFDSDVSYTEYRRRLGLYKGQTGLDDEEISHQLYAERRRRNDRHLSQSHPAQVQTVRRRRYVLNPVDELADAGQGQATQGVPQASVVAGQASTPDAAAPVLDGSEHVEPTPQGQAQEFIWRPSMAGLRGTLRPGTFPTQLWEALYEGRFDGFDTGLPEQTDAQVRTGVPGDEETQA
jgi:hypothetical protein